MRLKEFTDKHSMRSTVYLVAVFGGYDPNVILNRWTLRQLYATWEALQIKRLHDASVIDAHISSVLGGSKGPSKPKITVS